MVRRTYTPEQIINKLREVEVFISQGTTTAKASRKIGIGLGKLDFAGKQELLRLLVEKVIYNGQSIEIQTIIPLHEQLHPI